LQPVAERSARGGDVAARELDDDAHDVLIELAMTDAGTLARVIDAAGPMFSAQWGGRPRGTLKDIEMATPPLSSWLDDAFKMQRLGDG
jgi:hypothetical protein